MSAKSTPEELKRRISSLEKEVEASQVAFETLAQQSPNMLFCSGGQQNMW
jgi:hypothetical protein